MCATYGYNCQYPRDEGPSASFVDQPGHVEEETETEFERHDMRFSTNERRSQRAEVTERSGSGSPDAMDRGILDPVKTRYMGLHSAVAFPRSLGLDLQSANPPHLHSFAWNCGIRAEENPSRHQCLRDIITREEFDQYSAVFFSSVHPVFGIVDQQQFSKNCDQFWSTTPQITDFDAVIAGVVALGSYFSASMGHSREADIIEHAKNILEDPIFSRKPTIDQVSAWVLRTVYLRATTRPHVSWLTSSIAIHLAEATGLHHEMDSVVLTTDNIAKTIGRSHIGCEVARRLFWSAWAINTLISYEYGRSNVILNGITTKQVKQTEGDFSSYHIQLAQIVPLENQNAGSAASIAEIYKAFALLDQVPDTHPFITLSKADLSLCFYRRLRILKPGLERKCVTKIISIGNAALEAANQLAEEQRFWWQVLCTVFQYVCVLLAIDSHESLSNVSRAMETLNKISTLLGTHVAKEANTTAKILLRDSVRKKRAEVELLEKADVVAGLGDELTNFGVGDIDWDALLDPSFNGSAFMAQEFGVF
jgi:hypothetical protein